MRIVDVNDLPQWVKDLERETPTRWTPMLWTVDEQGDYHAWHTSGSFHRRDLKTRKTPTGVDPADVVDWYSLPTWIKGSYSSDDEMNRLKSYTWVKGSESTYFAYEPNGRYAGIWERE